MSQEDHSPVIAYKINAESTEGGGCRLHFWWATEESPEGDGNAMHKDYDTLSEAMRESAMILLRINGDIH